MLCVQQTKVVNSDVPHNSNFVFELRRNNLFKFKFCFQFHQTDTCRHMMAPSCERIIAELLCGRKPMRGAPLVSKRNLSIRDVLVVTSAYVLPYSFWGRGKGVNPTVGRRMPSFAKKGFFKSFSLFSKTVIRRL